MSADENAGNRPQGEYLHARPQMASTDEGEAGETINDERRPTAGRPASVRGLPAIPKGGFPTDPEGPSAASKSAGHIPVLPGGLEPPHLVPETSALSPELRERVSRHCTGGRFRGRMPGG